MLRRSNYPEFKEPSLNTAGGNQMLRFFKGLLSRKVKEPSAEAPYKVEAPVAQTAVIKEDPLPEAPAKAKKTRAPAKPRADKKPAAEKAPKKPRAKKSAK